MEKFQALIVRLIERTKVGKVAWEESSDSDTFEVSFPNSSIRLKSVEVRGTTTPDIVCEIINSEGTVVDAFSDRDLDSAGLDIEGRAPFLAMSSLFSDVRRRATGADQILNDIMKDLGGDIFE